MIELDAHRPHITLRTQSGAVVIPMLIAQEWANGRSPLPDNDILRGIIGAWLELLSIKQ